MASIKEISKRIDEGNIDESFYSLAPSEIVEVIEQCETKDPQIYKRIIYGLISQQDIGKTGVVVDWEWSYRQVEAEHASLKRKYDDLIQKYQKAYDELETIHLLEEWEPKDKKYVEKMAAYNKNTKIYFLTHDEEMAPIFYKFLKKRCQKENFDFLIDEEKYYQIQDLNARKIKANEMYEKYIKHHSKKEINIPSSMREKVKEALKIAPKCLFQNSKYEIIKILCMDVVPGFEDQDDYIEIVKKRGLSLSNDF